jgi:two-component system sensor histidine kinase GlrK
MPFWRPRSLLQLVLAGFFAALAPLCLAILFTVDTLDELATRERDITRKVIETSRLAQDIEAELLEMERHARQYMTLFDPELVTLALGERAALLEKLDGLQRLTGKASEDAAALAFSLTELELNRTDAPLTVAETAQHSRTLDTMNQHFIAINAQQRSLQTWLQAWIDKLLENSAAQAENVFQALFVQLSFLAFATLALLLLFSYWINKPVKELTQEIHQLGTAGLDRTIRISGPQEVKELGQKLDWLRERLQETEQEKQQFQRHISHELKTPLASLREGTDLLAEQVTGRLSQQQQEVVDIVRLNTIELQRLIENLIDYNQNAQRKELLLEEIDLRELWEEVVANYRISIDQKQLQLSLQRRVDFWTADRQRLKTSLDNLLSNAVNYTPAGGRINVVLRREAANLIIDIANSGDPIPTADVERVFEPFFQSTAKRTGAIKGSGIGLSVARECIKAQGGDLTLVTHDTLAVCFRLTCPHH